MAQSSLTIFSLPRELRDEIWVLVVSHDMRLLSGRHMPLEIYKTPSQSRRHLTVFNLLLVSRAVKREVTTTFRKRYTFTFHTSTLLRILLEHGISSWGCSKPSSEFLVNSSNLCPSIFFKMGHVSIFPNGPVYASRRRDDAFSWLRDGSRKRKMHDSTAHPPGWKTLDPGARRLLSFMHKSPMKLRSLEISAVLLFSIRAVRQLRKLRGVDLHFAFISEESKLRDKVLAIEDEVRTVKWLAETADTNIVLPIYKTQTDEYPISVAPLSCLVVALRREVASKKDTAPRVFSPNEMQEDLPFWIDFDDGSRAATESIIATCTKVSLSQPTSGWYRYSKRNPGVACLEMAQQPLPCEPLKRKMLKRQRQERARRIAGSNRFHINQRLRRSENLDVIRASKIYYLRLQDVVVANR
ncbi:hypothetical protein V8C42DRAFT_313632 [Trichoderma barbatum]